VGTETDEKGKGVGSVGWGGVQIEEIIKVAVGGEGGKFEGVKG